MYEEHDRTCQVSFSRNEVGVMSWERRSGPAAGRGPGLRAPSHVEDHDLS